MIKKTFKSHLPVLKQILLFALIFIFTCQFTATAQDKTALEVGQPAPDFYLKTINDEEIFLSNFCGEKNQKNPVLISFWGTYCKPCTKEFPIFNRLSELYSAHGLKIFLINVKEKKEIVETYIKKNNINVTVLLDTYCIVSEKYDVIADKIPKLFLIDKNGIIVQIYTGGITVTQEEMLKAQLGDILK